ncbi:hypothetical protein, partial [Staphylococcus aureus]
MKIDVHSVFFAILKQIEHAQKLELPFIYLGYWVPHSNKMNY